MVRTQVLYDELIDHLKTNYSQFDDYLRAGNSADISTIQSTLPDSTALLSWFDAGDRFLCLVLQKQGLSGYAVPRDSTLNNILTQFLEGLADKRSQQTDPKAFQNAAYQLKNQLLPNSLLAQNEQLNCGAGWPPGFYAFRSLADRALYRQLRQSTVPVAKPCCSVYLGRQRC